MHTKFISVRSPEKNNHIVIPQLWDLYALRNHEIKARLSPVNLGICFAVVGERSHPDECSYMACTEVQNTEDIPLGMTSMAIEAGRYAVFTHKGEISKIGMTMNYICGSWLPKSGHKLREAPDLELYDQRFKADSAESELDIYIPTI